ncbi:MAG: DUF2934 domain-containing protein [Deferrisomatales bacterium]
MAQARTKGKKDPVQTPAKTPRTRRARVTTEPGAGSGEALAAATGGEHAVDRVEMVRRAAYLRAERRGFRGGSPEQDWLEAEREVDEVLASEGTRLQAVP